MSEIVNVALEGKFVLVASILSNSFTVIRKFATREFWCIFSDFYFVQFDGVKFWGERAVVVFVVVFIYRNIYRNISIYR